MDLRHVILTLQSARDGNERIKVAAIDTALDFLTGAVAVIPEKMAKAEPQPAPNYQDLIGKLEADSKEISQMIVAAVTDEFRAHWLGRQALTDDLLRHLRDQQPQPAADLGLADRIDNIEADYVTQETLADYNLRFMSLQSRVQKIEDKLGIEPF
jgi:hypothetical protein